MQVIHFTSGDTYTFFAPRWDYFIAEDKIKCDLSMLRAEILWQEKVIIGKYEFEDDWGTKLGPDSLTSRSNRYNLLDWSDAQPLKQEIRKAHDEFISGFNFPPTGPLYVQCWANVMREGEKIQMHTHGRDPWTYLSGHICVEVDGTNTYYQNPFGGDPWASPNEVGKITLFPSYIPHFTDRVDSGIRITIAFDIYTQEGYHNSIKDDMKEHWVQV